jgi:hypothetical protein
MMMQRNKGSINLNTTAIGQEYNPNANTIELIQQEKKMMMKYN